MGGVKNDIKKGFTGTPDLQEVTDEGATTTNPIVVDNLGYKFIAKSNNIDVFRVYGNDEDNEAFIEVISPFTSTTKTLYTQGGALVKDDATSDFTSYGLSGININGTDYPLPTGVSSPLATLADIAGSFNAENLGNAIYNNLSIKSTPSDDDEFLVYDSITGEAVTIKYSDIKTPTESLRSTATSGTENAPNTSKDVVFIHEAGATANLTFAFPTNPTNNQKVTIMSVGGITTLTLTASVGTIINAITTLAIGGSATYMYLASQTKWYKIA